MLEKSTIARPYAQAVFELASESNQAEEWSAVLGLLSQVVADKQMRQLVGNPKISKQQLQELVIEICGKQLFKQAENFVRVLVNAGRMQYMPQIAKIFETLRSEAEGKIYVEVVTAYSLDSTQEEKIADSVTARLGKKVSISATVDESLIGGVVIRAGDSVIDASLRGRLNELANELA